MTLKEQLESAIAAAPHEDDDAGLARELTREVAFWLRRQPGGTGIANTILRELDTTNDEGQPGFW
jgi:hypothetical protein